jgi:regulator of protease activity HflC (stomatin/prohibitin superfamily)
MRTTFDNVNAAFESPEGLAGIASKVLVGLLVLVVLVSLISSFSVIAPGNTGVIFNIWTGSLRSVPQGMAWRMPWITQVQSYPTALRTYTMVRRAGEGSAIGDDSIDLPTLEGQHITQDISVTYNTSEDKAAQVFKSFRGADISEIEATFIRRTIITVAQNAAGQMSLSELISSKRDALQAVVQTSLSVELSKMGFALDKVNLGASHLPQTLEAQMQQKMAAQQQAQQAEYELQKQEMLAKAAVAKAEGEAQSVLVRAKAESEANRMLQTTLSAILIQNKTIEKWNGILPEVTGGGMPLLDLKNFKGAKE